MVETLMDQPRSLGWWPSLYEPFHTLGARIADWFSPPSEAGSDAEAYMVKVELPGVAAADVSLTVHDGVVTLSGEKRAGRETSGETWYFCERSYGRFTRSFRLPVDAKTGEIAAEMADGVLTIRAPRGKPAKELGEPVPIAIG